jgi:hypothetical protein
MTLLQIGNHAFALESAAIAAAIAEALAASPTYRLSNRIDPRSYWVDAGKIEITRMSVDDDQLETLPEPAPVTARAVLESGPKTGRKDRQFLNASGRQIAAETAPKLRRSRAAAAGCQ